MNGAAGDDSVTHVPELPNYILNWAFGRWTFTPSPSLAELERPDPQSTVIARMTLILARYESSKWQRKLETDALLEISGNSHARGSLRVERIG
jgi:hypothetical protein